MREKTADVAQMRRRHRLWLVISTNLNHALIRIQAAAVRPIEGKMTEECREL